jgi:hypothetical protein
MKILDVIETLLHWYLLERSSDKLFMWCDNFQTFHVWVSDLFHGPTSIALLSKFLELVHVLEVVGKFDELAMSLRTPNVHMRNSGNLLNNQGCWWPILYIQRLPQPLPNSSCYWPCRNPYLFDVELATQSLSLFLTNPINRNLVHLKRP